MNPVDPQMLTGIAEIGWILIPILTPLLALLIPFMIWRIWRATSASRKEMVRLNERLDRAITVLEKRGTGRSVVPNETIEPPLSTAADEVNLPAPDEEILSPAPIEEDLPPAASVNQKDFPGEFGAGFSETGDLPEFDTIEPEAVAEPATAEEPPREEEDMFSFSPNIDWTPPETGFDEEPFASAEPAAAEEPEAAEEFPSFDFPESQPQVPEEEPPVFEAPEPEPEPEPVVEEKPAITRLEDDPSRPEVSLARCGGCGHKLAYKKALTGKNVKCPSCKTPFVLP